MTIVWRVCHPETKRGPYTGLGSQVFGDEPHIYVGPTAFRCPEPPPGVSRAHQGVFGFKTLEQAYRWFTETEFARLFQHGYRLMQMVADAVLYEDSHQCVFIPEDKSFLAHLPDWQREGLPQPLPPLRACEDGGIMPGCSDDDVPF